MGEWPLILRLGFRLLAFVVLFIAIGFANSVATHYLTGGVHLDWFTESEISAYRGGLNMLLILWFFGLLRPSPTQSGQE